MNNETKNEKFKRLAKQRGDRALKDINLLGNLSNRNNYEYSDQEVKRLFSILDEELRSANEKFKTRLKREIRF